MQHRTEGRQQISQQQKPRMCFVLELVRADSDIQGHDGISELGIQMSFWPASGFSPVVWQLVATWEEISVVFYLANCTQSRLVFFCLFAGAAAGAGCAGIGGRAFSASWQGAAVLPAKLLRCKLGMKRCLLITRTVISVDQVLFSPSLWKCRND